ncbi:MAG: hypothetical protein KAJ12_04955 [Bacteroidetes bacterium]|nr:hypothetical protein [Bacteroidota bacterium]
MSAPSCHAGYFPDSEGKPYVWGVSPAAAGLTGYLRIAAGDGLVQDPSAGLAAHQYAFQYTF